MKKIAQLPIKPHIKKFIIHHSSKYLNYDYDVEKNLLELKQRIPFLKITNTVHPREYFQKISDGTYINVMMENANDHNLYALNRQLEKDFQHQMFVFLNTSKCIYDSIGLQFCAMDSIRNFLDSHDIQEEEYNIGTAYKLWQRYMKKKTEKRKAFLTAVQALATKRKVKWQG